MEEKEEGRSEEVNVWAPLIEQMLISSFDLIPLILLCLLMRFVCRFQILSELLDSEFTGTQNPVSNSTYECLQWQTKLSLDWFGSHRLDGSRA